MLSSFRALKDGYRASDTSTDSVTVLGDAYFVLPPNGLFYLIFIFAIHIAHTYVSIR